MCISLWGDKRYAILTLETRGVTLGSVVTTNHALGTSRMMRYSELHCQALVFRLGVGIAILAYGTFNF